MISLKRRNNPSGLGLKLVTLKNKIKQTHCKKCTSSQTQALFCSEKNTDQTKAIKCCSKPFSSCSKHILCILTREQVLCTRFAGRNHFFDFIQVFQTETEKKKGKRNK